MTLRSRVQAADDDDDFHSRQRRNEAQRKKHAKAKKKARAEQAATKDCLLYQLSPRPAHSPPFNRTRAIAALKEAPETTHHTFSYRTTIGRLSSANITVRCSRGLTVVQRIGATELGKHQEQESHLKQGREILSNLFAASEEGAWFTINCFGWHEAHDDDSREADRALGWMAAYHHRHTTSLLSLLERDFQARLDGEDTQAGWKWLQDLLGDRRGSMPLRIRRRHREASSKPSSRSSALVALSCRGARLRLIRDFGVGKLLLCRQSSEGSET